MMRTVLLLGVLVVGQSIQAADFSIVESKGKYIDVAYNKAVVLRLMTANDVSTPEKANETYKVYAHVMDPLDASNEQTLTKGAGDKFTHHRGIFLGFSRATVEGVGGVDTWHMKNGVRQHYKKILVQKVSDETATLTVAIDWVKGDQLLLEEERTFVVHAPADNGSVVIDNHCQVSASTGRTVLKGDPEHAGLQFRANEAVVRNKSAKYLFPKDMQPGLKGDRDMPWAAMRFKVGEQEYHVQHMSHPSLPKGNIYSAYRDYGRFGAYFVQELEKGEMATFKVRFYISPGAFSESDLVEMNERYADYVKAVQ